MSEFQEKYQRNLEVVKKFQQNNTFRHDDINQFYLQHQGDDGDLHSEIHFFIPTLSPFYIDFHVAIYRLLLFLDLYGEVLLPIGKSDHTITLRQHTLSVTEIILRSLGNKRNDCSKSLFFIGGIAALSCNVGRGLGTKYCEQYNNINDKISEQASLGQASLALLEQIPEVNSLNCYEELKEIIRLYHIHIESSINSAKFPFEKDNTSWKLAKMLAAAELQVRRKEIFSIAEKPEGSWSADEEIKKKNVEEAAEIAQQAEGERKAIENKKLKAYKDELRNLQKKVMSQNMFIAALEKLIAALEKNDQEAITQAKKELHDLRKSISKDLDQGPSNEPPLG